MPYDLRITFTGLCLYTVEPGSNGGRSKLRVLMPKPMAGMEAHVARVLYDKAYEDPNADKPTWIPRSMDLTGEELEILVSRGKPIPAQLEYALPDNLADLYAYTGKGVPASLLTAKLGDPVASRVTLDSGYVTDWNEAGPWMMGMESRCLVWRFTWTIPGMGDPDSFDLKPKSGSPSTTLYPHDGRIDLLVYHAPAQEIPTSLLMPIVPTPVEPGTRAMHFCALYDLLDNVDPATEVMPQASVQFSGKPCLCGDSGGLMGATVATCMGGKAPVDPG